MEVELTSDMGYDSFEATMGRSASERARMQIVKKVSWLSGKQTVLYDVDNFHILRYRDHKLLRFGFFLFKGTVFSFKSSALLWLKLFLLLIVALATALFTTKTTDEAAVEQGSQWTMSLASTSAFLNTLVVFFLSFHVADVKTIFLSTREAVTALAAALQQLVFVYNRNCPFTPNVHPPSSTDHIIRYSESIFALLWVEMNPDCRSELLMNMNLEDDERVSLNMTTHPSWPIFNWMEKLHNVELPPNQGHDVAISEFHQAILNARSAYGTAKQRCESQMPFPYVHMLSVISNMALIVIAMDAGQDAGVNYIKNNNAQILFDVFKVCMTTLVYQGLLELQIILGHPLTISPEHPAHLPRHYLQEKLHIALQAIVDPSVPHCVSVHQESRR